MTVVLRNRHWAFFFVLLVTQLGGLWISLSRSPYGPAVVDFAHRAGWTMFMLPVGCAFGSAFTTTVMLAKLTEVFTKRK